MQRKKNYIVIPTQSWDIPKVGFGQVLKRECFRIKTIPLTYQNQRFFLKTQPLICLFGVLQPKKQMDQTLEELPYYLKFAFDSVFLQKTHEFDEHIITQATEQNWLDGSKKKPFSPEVVGSRYLQMTRVSPRGECSLSEPFLKVMLPVNYHNPKTFKTQFYDEQNELLPNISVNNIKETIPARAQCSVLLHGQVIIYPNNMIFGVSWHAVQIKISLPPEDWPQQGCCLLTSDEIAPNLTPSSCQKKTTREVSDSDSDSDSDEELEEKEVIEEKKEIHSTSKMILSDSDDEVKKEIHSTSKMILSDSDEEVKKEPQKPIPHPMKKGSDDEVKKKPKKSTPHRKPK